MPVSELRLIKRCVEFLDTEQIKNVQPYTRGIYVLFNHRPKLGKYDVVYIGMAGGLKAGIRGRLKIHLKHKAGLWTHFSAFEVWDNIREEEVIELEGIFRHIFRRDTRANSLNKQRSFKKLDKIGQQTKREKWMKTSS